MKEIIQDYLLEQNLNGEIYIYDSKMFGGPTCFIYLTFKELEDGSLEYINSIQIKHIQKVLNAFKCTLYKVNENLGLRFDLIRIDK